MSRPRLPIPLDPVRPARSRPDRRALTAARVATGAVVAVGLGVVGIRLTADAGDVTSRVGWVRPDFAVQAARAAGVTTVAAAQLAALSVVWSTCRRRAPDTLFALAVIAVGVVAAFAAVVLVAAGQ
ncbi:MAG: hypothetical protein JWO31_3680 [Phycisphaerales bacterium]|nr:hypothetical protein [Phycisphaerales bacterium]